MIEPGKISTANSGTVVEFAAGVHGSVPQAAKRLRLAQWSMPGFARPLVVKVGWSGRGDGIVFDPAYAVYSGRPAVVYSVGDPTYPGNALFLEIECGAGAQQTVFSCDAVEGSIALPPCEVAKVSLVVLGASQSLDYPISAAILEGEYQNAPAPTFTQLLRAAAGNYTRTLPIPPCARAVDIYPSFDQSETLANQNTVTLKLTASGGSNAGSPLVVRDYVNSKFQPNAGPVDWCQWGSDLAFLTYTQTAAFSSATVLRWFIAP